MSSETIRMPGDAAMFAEKVRVGYGDKIILQELSLEIRRGEVTALVGPNGSGKSTLLKGMARLLKLHGGSVYIENEEIAKLSNVEIARRLGVLPQSPTAPAGLTVGELVEQGRYPHAGPMRMLKKQDHEAIGRALELTGTLEFVNRPLENLSGGERQRAWIALTLAQSTPILFLDEPTTFLDIGHQLEVLELVEHLNRDQGMTIVMVLHDLNQAAQYAHRMVVLRKGTIVADGAPTDVLTGPILEKVFNIKAHILQDPTTGRPVFLPYAVVPKDAPVAAAAPTPASVESAPTSEWPATKGVER